MAFFKYPKVNSFLDMNSCRSQPCQNGGQCHNQGTSYNCQCAPGYYGNHCEHGKCWPDMVDFNQTGYIGAVQNDGKNYILVSMHLVVTLVNT